MLRYRSANMLILLNSSYLRSTMESFEFVEAIKSGFPWSVVESERWIIGLEIKPQLCKNSIAKTLKAAKSQKLLLF